MPAGRPSKFAPDVVDDIVRLVSEGHYLTEVAPFLGLSRSVVRSWLTRGKRTGEADKPYREFLSRYQKACAERIISLEKSSRTLARVDGAHALRMLAVLKSSRYSAETNILRELKREILKLKAMIAGGKSDG